VTRQILAAFDFLSRLFRPIVMLRFVDAATLNGRLESGEKIALIDVRGAAEFTGPLGHIAGARNIPLADLSARINQLAALKTQPLITI